MRFSGVETSYYPPNPGTCRLNEERSAMYTQLLCDCDKDTIFPTEGGEYFIP